MLQSSFSRRSTCLAAVLALAAFVGSAAFSAEPPPSDWPADKCVFQQTIPCDEPIDPYSDQLIQDITDMIGGQTRLAVGSWTMSVYHVNGTNYQLEDFYVSNAWCPMGYWMRDVPVPTDQTIRVTPNKDTDQNLAIHDPVHGMEYSIWRPAVDRNGVLERNAQGYYECENCGFVFTNTSGSNPIACSLRGPSISHSVGLIYPGELSAGAINHALAFAIPNPASDPCPPATYSDGNDFGNVEYPDRLPESAVFRLKPSIWTDEVIESQAWTLTEKAVAKAARDYGVYITDNSGSCHFYGNNLYTYPGAEPCNENDPYASIDGTECSRRNKSDKSYVRLWPSGFMGPDNFEVLDRVFIPYPRDDRHADYDSDGMTNASETAFGYRDGTFYVEHNDPSNGPLDWDADGLTNAQEIELREHFRYITLNPLDADSDGDGHSDYEEALDWSADPTNPFVVPDPSWPGMPEGTNLALGRPATGVNFANPELAVDGDESTASEAGENQTGSITVDLGASTDISRVVIKWLGIGHCFGVGYTVEVSPDNQNWTPIHTETEGEGGIDDCYDLSGNGRYVKVDITDLGSPWGLHIFELEVYGAGGPQPPVAEFSGNPTSGPPPLTVYFTDLSSGDPTSWDWTFGDSGTSQAQHPSHEYTAVNTYTVSLEACNAQGCDTETKVDYIEVSDQSCHVGAIDLVGKYKSTGAPSSRGYYAEATITVHDQDCAVLAGVTVDISWSGCVSGNDSDVTDENGQVVLNSPVNPDGGEFTCCVDNLTKDGYPYNSGDNHETCDTIYNP